jgi:hypothetical protein
VQAKSKRPRHSVQKVKKPKRRTHRVLAARHIKRVTRKPLKRESLTHADVRVAAPVVILVAALLGVSLLLIAGSVTPPWVFPRRVGAMIAHHRADLATAGVTGTLCLLFAFVIAWMA